MFEEGSRLRTIGGSAFQGCCDLFQITFPEGLTSIERYAFSECRWLAHVQLPERLEKIGANCFANSGLEEIVFPASMREVGTRAFEWCK